MICGIAALSPGAGSDHFGILLSDRPPLVGGWDAIGVAIGQTVCAGLAPCCVAGAAALRDFDEAERDQLADRWCSHAAMNSVFFKLGERHDQLAVVGATVAGELDLQA